MLAEHNPPEAACNRGLPKKTGDLQERNAELMHTNAILARVSRLSSDPADAAQVLLLPPPVLSELRSYDHMDVIL